MIATAGCVLIFWSLVTVFAAALRRLIFSLKQPEDRPHEDVQHNDSVQFLSNEVRTSRASRLNRSARQIFNWWGLSDASILALLDTVATMEVCACSLECWPVRAAAGDRGLLLAIALNSVRGALFTCNDACGSPCNPWYRFIHGKSSLLWVGITWAMQLLGSHAALSLAKVWWSLNLTEHHTSRYNLLMFLKMRANESSQISSDLHVSPYAGFFIEGFGTLVDFYLAFLFTCVLNIWNDAPSVASSSAVSCADRSVHRPPKVMHAQLPSRLRVFVSFFIRICLNLSLTAKCIGLTGMYINPVNAYIQNWGVGDVSLRTHLFVYWLGPFCGVWISVQLEDMTFHLLRRIRQPHGATVYEYSASESSVPGSSSSVDHSSGYPKLQYNQLLTASHRELKAPSNPG